MKNLGILLVLAGGALALLGLAFLALGRWPFLGRLPGDLRIEGKSVSFYFPITTCLIVSLVLTILLNLVAGLFRR